MHESQVKFCPSSKQRNTTHNKNLQADCFMSQL